jgi:hypothetical protein
MSDKIDTSKLEAKGNIYRPEKLVKNYDYSNISAADKELVEEFCKILVDREGVPTIVLINELKTRFQLENQKYMQKNESRWYEYTKDILKDSQYVHQGFKNVKQKNNEVLRIPHYAISLDLDQYDLLLEHIEKKIIKNFLENLEKTKNNVKK